MFKFKKKRERKISMKLRMGLLKLKTLIFRCLHYLFKKFPVNNHVFKKFQVTDLQILITIIHEVENGFKNISCFDLNI